MNLDGNDSFLLDVEIERHAHDHWQKTAYIKLRRDEQDEQGRPVLSPDCRTAVEVNEWADDLIGELQRIKRQAARMQWDNYQNAR